VKSGAHRIRVFTARVLDYVHAQDDFWSSVGQTPIDDERIHEIRVSLKRLRAVVNLLELAGISVGDVDARLRRLGKPWGVLRDAAIVGSWIDKNTRGDVAVFDTKGRRIERVNGERIGSTARKVRALIVKIKKQLVDHSGDFDVAKAVEESYRRSRRSWRRVEESRQAEDFHRLRMRTKHLQYQLEACRSRRAEISVRSEDIRRLSHRLGLLHDLWIIKNFLRAPEGKRFNGQNLSETLRHARARERRRVENSARRFFAEKPKVFVASLF
jgi:CHAD domain-containing protein